MTRDKFQELLGTQGETCISIIVPTHEVSRERRNDKITIKNMVNEAKEKLGVYTHSAEYEALCQKLDELTEKVDYNHNEKGLGLYVSPTQSLKVLFPFEVQQKIVIDDKFEWSDLAYLMGLSQPYHLLLLSEKKVRLLAGQLNHLAEIHSDDFPDEYEDRHEYAKPGRGSSYSPQANVKGFEKDKSVMEQLRTHDYFKVVDKHLQHQSNDKSPLIVAAPIEELAMYDDVTSHKERIVARIQGNYLFKTPAELGDMCYPYMAEHINLQNKERVNDFTESIGYGRGMQDIREIIKAAKEGRVRTLLMERDYRNQDYDINQLLCEVYNHKGEVVVMDKDIMVPLPGLVAMLRY